MNKMKLRIKYFEGATKLKKISIGDWIDVYAAETVMLFPKGIKKIRLGFALELPKGYEGRLLPRSSTPSTWGIMLAHGEGMIDNSYCGDNDEWQFQAYNCTNRLVKVEKGDKIGQFRIIESQPELEFIEVESFGNPDRGGFGTTGTK